jgi:exodeoxyribonuclease VII large subunit
MQDKRTIYSVRHLNSELRQVLDGSFPLIWVQGEISNLSSPRSGHLYFSLKDEQAQIRCALFRNKRNLLRIKPSDGDRVLVRARITLYEPRGDCQLIIEHMEAAGSGLLQQAFEQLKAKLDQEGLFAKERKLPLPPYPKRVGIITSPSGAALQDILNILQRRYPSAAVTVYPSSVQGENAAEELQQALQLALERAEADVLILGRGGGSLEDLAAFNDEKLARTIAAANIPIVSAVGHETDFTIADFVADRRAPTPSAAAELVTPEQQALAQQFLQYANRLQQRLQQKLQQIQQQLDHQEQRLQRAHPGSKLRQQQQALDTLQQRVMRTWQQLQHKQTQQLDNLQQRLHLQHPATRIQYAKQQIHQQQKRLHKQQGLILQQKTQQLQNTAQALHTLSPLATLQRGYSIVQRADKTSVVRSSHETQPGEKLHVRLAEGSLEVEVTQQK